MNNPVARLLRRYGWLGSVRLLLDLLFKLGGAMTSG